MKQMFVITRFAIIIVCFVVKSTQKIRFFIKDVSISTLL